MDCVYYGTTLKLALYLHTAKLLQFWLSTRCIKTNEPPLKKEKKLAEAVTLSENKSIVWIMYPALIQLYF